MDKHKAIEATGENSFTLPRRKGFRVKWRTLASAPTRERCEAMVNKFYGNSNSEWAIQDHSADDTSKYYRVIKASSGKVSDKIVRNANGRWQFGEQYYVDKDGNYVDEPNAAPCDDTPIDTAPADDPISESAEVDAVNDDANNAAEVNAQAESIDPVDSAASIDSAVKPAEKKEFTFRVGVTKTGLSFFRKDYEGSSDEIRVSKKEVVAAIKEGTVNFVDGWNIWWDYDVSINEDDEGDKPPRLVVFPHTGGDLEEQIIKTARKHKNIITRVVGVGLLDRNRRLCDIIPFSLSSWKKIDAGLDDTDTTCALPNTTRIQLTHLDSPSTMAYKMFNIPDPNDPAPSVDDPVNATPSNDAPTVDTAADAENDDADIDFFDDDDSDASAGFDLTIEMNDAPFEDAFFAAIVEIPAADPVEGITDNTEQSIPMGAECTLKTDNGSAVRVVYSVKAINDVIASHRFTGSSVCINMVYPAEFQPRNRESVVLQTQVYKMARGLDPAMLTASVNLNQGAPIVRADGVVLNGNGRVMAIALAYSQGYDSGKGYRQHLIEHAADFGLTAESVKTIDQPVLVRVIADELDSGTLDSVIHSTIGGSDMSGLETAIADAARLKIADFADYDDDYEGDLTNARNTGFVGKIIYRLAKDNERARYYLDNGALSKDAVERVKRALFALAYNDDGLLEKMTASTDEGAKNISNALISVAPNFAKLALQTSIGVYHSYDFAATLATAVKRYEYVRGSEYPSVEHYFRQGTMFDRESPAVEHIMRFFDANKRNQKWIKAFLIHIIDVIKRQGAPIEITLGGFAQSSPLTLDEVVLTAIKHTNEAKGGGIDLFIAEASDDRIAADSSNTAVDTLDREFQQLTEGAESDEAVDANQSAPPSVDTADNQVNAEEVGNPVDDVDVNDAVIDLPTAATRLSDGELLDTLETAAFTLAAPHSEGYQPAVDARDAMVYEIAFNRLHLFNEGRERLVKGAQNGADYKTTPFAPPVFDTPIAPPHIVDPTMALVVYKPPMGERTVDADKPIEVSSDAVLITPPPKFQNRERYELPIDDVGYKTASGMNPCAPDIGDTIDAFNQWASDFIEGIMQWACDNGSLATVDAITRVKIENNAAELNAVFDDISRAEELDNAVVVYPPRAARMAPAPTVKKAKGVGRRRVKAVETPPEPTPVKASEPPTFFRAPAIETDFVPHLETVNGKLRIVMPKYGLQVTKPPAL